jgi:glutathione S-transferase
MKLWHCVGARSLRALWTLEELGFDYELEVMPFPPRVFQRDYLEVNPSARFPSSRTGVAMTESCAICQYLATARVASISACRRSTRVRRLCSTGCTTPTPP